MQKTDALFRLIKGLNKNEKGYFKKFFSSGSKATNYMLLFDAIDKQQEYDEAAIMRKFRKEAFVKQLSVTKNYLFEQILKSQRAYHNQDMLNAQLNNRLENAEVLFTHALYGQSLDELQSATEMALQYDQPLKLLEIKARERALHLEIAAKDWDQQIGKNVEETRALIAQYSFYLDLFSIYYRLMYFWRHERTIRTQEQKQEFEMLMQSPVLKQHSKNSFYNEQLQLTIQMIYNFISNNDKESFSYMKQILDMWDKNPHMKKVEPVKYISAVNNYFNNCAKLERIDLIREYLTKFDNSIIEKNEAVEAIVFETFSTYKTLILFAENRFEEASSLLEETRKGIKKFEGRINRVRLMLLRFNSLILYMVQNKFSEAIDMANEILDEKDVDLRRDMQAATRIIYLMLHFELNNAVMLENAIRSSKRYLQTRDKYFETEKIFFRHFLQLNHSSDKQQRQKVCMELRTELTALMENDPLERNFLQTFNIFNWLNAKIEGISLQELLIQQSKAEQSQLAKNN
ncbi:MAG: hypothetical protein U0V74_05145 [Chitinophagales bacterium]